MRQNDKWKVVGALAVGQVMAALAVIRFPLPSWLRIFVICMLVLSLAGTLYFVRQA